jgi:hypothetical protein
MGQPKGEGLLGQRQILSPWASAVVLFAIAGSAAAQDASVVTRVFPNPTPPLGQAVGPITVEVTCPSARVFARGQTDIGRSVRITVSKPGTEYRAVISQLLLGGAMTSFQACPMAHVEGAMQVPDRTVDALDVFAPSYAGGPAQHVLHADHFANDSGTWDSVSDELAQAPPPATAAQAPAQAVPSAAVVVPEHKLTKAERRAQRRAARRAAAEARAQLAAQQAEQARQKARSDAFFRTLLGWAEIAALLGLLWLVFQNRVAILRWYYFHFDPHPAEAVFRTAIASSDDMAMNPASLANALSELPPSGAVRRKVRLEQAERLYGELRSASIARQQAYAERARKDASLLHEQTAFRGMQEALALAAVALERAKVAYATAINLRAPGVRG